MKSFAATLVLTSILGIAQVYAQESGAAAKHSAAEQQIVEKINQAVPQLPVADIAASAVPGLYEVSLVNGERLFVTQDGKHFVVGELYELQPEGVVNLTEQQRDRDRAQQIAAIDESQMIIFSPEQKKASVTVFTDVDCSYCQRLHAQMDEYLALGIEIRYLAFPRTGLNTESYDKVVAAWCAQNPQQALTRLKAGGNMSKANCANPVADQYRLGNLVGVRGTPAVITASGQIVGGYLPPQQLAQVLGL